MNRMDLHLLKMNELWQMQLNVTERTFNFKFLYVYIIESGNLIVVWLTREETVSMILYYNWHILQCASLLSYEECRKSQGTLMNWIFILLDVAFWKCSFLDFHVLYILEREISWVLLHICYNHSSFIFFSSFVGFHMEFQVISSDPL